MNTRLIEDPVILYGSRARGVPTQISDYDIVVAEQRRELQKRRMMCSGMSSPIFNTLHPEKGTVTSIL